MEDIKQRRMSLNYSQREVAKQIEISPRQYARYEDEPLKIPLGKAIKLARVLHLSFKQFIELIEK